MRKHPSFLWLPSSPSRSRRNQSQNINKLIALLSPFTNKDKRLTLNIPDPYDAHPPEDTKRLVEAAGFEIIRSILLEKPKSSAAAQVSSSAAPTTPPLMKATDSFTSHSPANSTPPRTAWRKPATIFPRSTPTPTTTRCHTTRSKIPWFNSQMTGPPTSVGLQSGKAKPAKAGVPALRLEEFLRLIPPPRPDRRLQSAFNQER